jgi:hypothetical protein
MEGVLGTELACGEESEFNLECVECEMAENPGKPMLKLTDAEL